MKETLFSRCEKYVTALLETSDSEEEEEEEEKDIDIGPPTHITEEDYRGLLEKNAYKRGQRRPRQPGQQQSARRTSP